MDSLKWVDGDSHVELTPNYTIPIELIEEISVNFQIRIPTEVLKEYCVIKFKYESEGGMKVFTSLTNKEPNYSNCDRKKEGRP